MSLTTDLTSGPPLRRITSFAWPLLVGLLFQQAYQLADAVVVGRMIGMHALAAVGASGGIIFLLLGFTMGLTNGLAIPVARAVGARDADGVRRSVATGAAISAVVTAVITIGGIPLARSLLVWLKTPAELLPDATAFLTIILGGSVTIVAFNYLSAIIRALGDSTTPLIFLAASSLLNVVGVVALVAWTPLGVAGAALATVLAQLTTVIACLVLVARRMPQLRPSGEQWRPREVELVESARLGLPMGFQMSIIAIGTLVLQYAINGLGADAVAAFTAASRVDFLAMTPMQAAGLAMATYVAQNRGAGQWSRIRQGVRQMAWLISGVAVVVGVVNILWGTHMVRVFAAEDAHAESIVQDAHTLLTVNGFLYVILGLLFVFRSALQGMGDARISTISGVIELVLRSGAALVLVAPLGFLGTVLAAPLAWAGALVVLWWAWERMRRGLLLREGMPAVQTDVPVPTVAAAATT